MTRMNLVDVQPCPQDVMGGTSLSASSCRQQESHLRRISMTDHESSSMDSYGVFPRKKRKLSAAPIACASTSQISMDFLSGIFRDLSESANSNCDIHQSKDPVSTVSKRCRTGSLTSVRSLATLQDERLLSQTAAADTEVTEQDSSSDALAAQIVDTVFASRDMPKFPDLPHTISASSCCSNNLTLTSVPAAQVTENQNHNSTLTSTHNIYMLEAASFANDEKDEYGFYVDLDNDSIHQRLESVTKATETCRRSLEGVRDLAFSSSLLAKGEPVSDELDSDTAWAKAADTVDDVLGDLF